MLAAPQEGKAHMKFQTSLTGRMADLQFDQTGRALQQCELARRLEESGKYEAAREAISEWWQRIGARPRVEMLERSAAAEVLLRAGALSGFIGSATQIEGAQESAKDLIGESITIFDALRETAKVAEASSYLALCYWREGAFDEARVILQDALRRLTDEDTDVKALVLLRAASFEIAATRYQDALSILMEAAPLFEASRSHMLKGKFHGELANMFEILGPAEQREDYIDRALVEYAAANFHFEQAGHTGYRARSENNLGLLFLTIGRCAEAHEHLDRARRLFFSLKESGTVAHVDETRARAFLAQGRNMEAERAARAAVRAFERGDENAALAEALTTLGTALARLGQHEQARAFFERAVKVAQQAGAQNSAGLAAVTMLEELSAALKSEERRELYERADEFLAGTQHAGTLQRLRHAARRVLAAEQRSTERPEPSTETFIYASDESAQLLRHAHRIAGTPHAALITGETGTGKNLLARLIHRWSGRSGKFVEIACATISETPSRLFGHRKGSFAGATGDVAGAAREAAGGTLLLDDIGELSITEQTKLLRLIEYGEIHPLGASQPESIDLRIVATANSQLHEKLAHKLFREDLFYRLQAFHVSIPPLRERPADIPALAEHFIKEAAGHQGERVEFAPEAIAAMQQLPLPGNAHELRALIEQIALTTAGTVITSAAIETLALRQTMPDTLANVWSGCHLDEEVRLYEGKLIRQALAA
ncbi:MAG: two-component system, NtrC family, response regulator AtoC, partial [Blastocatellia bacterium]|nr:two-component system, NtrC family, response regulator AtoC [Blastocatellia bacterium]